MAPKGVELEGSSGGVLAGSIGPVHENVTLTEYFQRAFTDGRIRSDSVAIIDDSTEVERSVTFQQLDYLSDNLATVLPSLIDADETQNSDGDIVVGICIPPCEQLIIAMFAILKAGWAYLPMDPCFPESRIERIVGIARPVLLIVDEEKVGLEKFNCVRRDTKILLLADVLEKSRQLVEDGQYLMKQKSRGEVQRVREPESVASVLFTSGSSGPPKGVRLCDRTILNRLAWHWTEFPFGGGEKCCLKTSITFVDSIPEIFGTLLQGIPLVIFPKVVVSQPHLFLSKVEQHKLSRLILVPSFLRSILTVLQIEGQRQQNAKAKLDTVKLVMSSGETLPFDLIKDFFLLLGNGKTLYNAYGSTEVGDVSWETFNSLQEAETKCIVAYDSNDSVRLTPIGNGTSVCHNTIISIVDENMNIVGDGNIEEIHIRGHSLAKGYVGIRDSDKFLENYKCNTKGFDMVFRMGDFGEIKRRRDGNPVLYYHGRSDSQVKIRGHRVELLEVQENIKNCPGVEQVVVLCFHPGGEDQAIVAFVIPAEGATKFDVEAQVSSRLLPYQIPRIKFVDAFPYLVNGKVDRQSLLLGLEEDKKRESMDWNLANVEGNNRVRFEILVRVINQVAGIPYEVILNNLDGSFFNIGGTSLNSLTVIYKLMDFGFCIGIQEFVTAASIKELVEAMYSIEEEKHADLSLPETMKDEYIVEQMREEHRDETLELFSRSFAEKGDLEVWLPPTDFYTEYYKWFGSLWDYFLSHPYSYVVRKKDGGNIVGAAVNYDEDEEPDNYLGGNQTLQIISTMISQYEDEQRPYLPRGSGKLLGNFLVGTAPWLSAGENVRLIQFMEYETIRLGKRYNFEAMLCTNTSPITQEIARKNPSCKILKEVQINQWQTSDGKKPFGAAPDSQIVQICATFLK